MAPREILRTQGLGFAYSTLDETGERRDVQILKDLDLAIEEGDFVAITGPSGSGKSTLFYLLGCLLRPSEGRIFFDGEDVSAFDDRREAEFRNRKIGFVFQQFHLLPRASVLENILLPARYPIEDSAPTPADREKARALAERLGLGPYLERGPQQLSGGQQQRVAVARALMRDTRILLADEPTGNLDSKNTAEILKLFRELNAEGRTIVLITHDPQVAAQCRTVIRLRDGRIEAIDRRADAAPLMPSTPSSAPRRSGAPAWGSPARLVWKALPEAFANLRRNRVKSLLTMLGVVIGVAAVLSTVTLGQFAKRRILQSYESLGVNTLTFRGYPNWRARGGSKGGVRYTGFDWERDWARLPQVFTELELLSPSYVSWGGSVARGGLTVSEDVRPIGVSQDYAVITDQKVAQGRPLSSLDMENGNAVCVLGATLGEKLFPDGLAVGNIVQVMRGGDQGSYPCRVVGVNAKQGSPTEWWQPDLLVNMPYTYFKRVNGSLWEGSLYTVTLRVRNGFDPAATADKLRGFFEQRYGDGGEFRGDSNAKLVSQMKLFLGVFSSLLATVALITLGVGGVGINNMMLVSLAERLKEIGLRKALGATGRSLRFQILAESLLLSVVAGLVGLVAGFAPYQAAIFAATKFIKELRFEWIADPWALGVSAGAMVLTGVLSGFVPSLKAERLQVVDALRSE